MSVTWDQPAPYTIRSVELKKQLEASGDKPAKVILKLGLTTADGQAGSAEMFCDVNPETWPAEGKTETLVLKAPKQEGWAASAFRPRAGGGRPPQKDTGSIEAQVAFKGAIEFVIARELSADTVAGLTKTFLAAIREAKA